MKKITLIFFLVISLKSFGQNENVSRFIFNANLHQGWRTMGEVAFGFGEYGTGGGQGLIYHRQSIQAGSEFNFSARHFILGPKISYNYSLGFFGAGFSAGGAVVYYTDFEYKTICLAPHFGFAGSLLLGKSTFLEFDLYFNLNIPVMETRMNDFVNRFAITLAVPFSKMD